MNKVSYLCQRKAVITQPDDPTQVNWTKNDQCFLSVVKFWTCSEVIRRQMAIFCRVEL